MSAIVRERLARIAAEDRAREIAQDAQLRALSRPPVPEPVETVPQTLVRWSIWLLVLWVPVHFLVKWW